MHEGRKEEDADGAVTAAIVFARLSLSLSPRVFLPFLSLSLSRSFADHNLPASGCRRRCRLCLCRRTGNDLSRRLDTHATTAAPAASSPDQPAIGELLVAARLQPPETSVGKVKRDEQ